MGFADVVRKTWEGHHLFSVLLELTYRCNLSCWFCYNDLARTGEPLGLDDYGRLLEELAELQVFQLVLTGGEPLVHPDFFAIGSRARDLGFVIRLKTNGHVLDARLAERLRREVDPFVVEISLHGARAETHEQQTRIAGSFERLMRHLPQARDAGLRVKLHSTLTRWNEDELEAMMDLADELRLPLHIDPVVTVRDDGDDAPLSIGASAAGLETLLRLQRERARAAAMTVGRDADQWMDAPTAAKTPEPQQAAATVESPGNTKHCGAGTGGLAIDPYGDVFPCVQWRVPVGNIRQSSIRELWTGSEALENVRRQNEEAHAEVAARGEWGKALGFCPGAAALETGSPTGIYPAARRRADLTRRLAKELGEGGELEEESRPDYVERPAPTVEAAVGNSPAVEPAREGEARGRGRPLLPVVR